MTTGSDEDASTRVRIMNERDLSQAVELSTAAGWNQTENDWRLLSALAPEGCLAIDCEGTLAATTTLICYDGRLAWIGMVLTHTRFRRRGFARALVREALRIADSRSIPTVKLDATSMGQPIYQSLGFEPEHSVERWWSESPKTAAASPEVTPGWRAAQNLDEISFGVDRSRLLEHLAADNTVLSSRSGYVFTRSGRCAHYLGPCVADHAEAAEMLIETALAAHGGGAWVWDLFPDNPECVSLARRLGFSMQRSLVRMRRGRPMESNRSLVRAIAGFEFG